MEQFLNFMGSHPILTVILVFIVCETLVEIFKVFKR